jgi:hypothetical protein
MVGTILDRRSLAQWPQMFASAPDHGGATNQYSRCGGSATLGVPELPGATDHDHGHFWHCDISPHRTLCRINRSRFSGHRLNVRKNPRPDLRAHHTPW